MNITAILQNRRVRLFSLSLIICNLSFCPAWAQIEVEDDEIDDDEITVTDEQGNEEEIEFPEAMTYDLDSLMNQYMSQTYLSSDPSAPDGNDCNSKNENPVYTKEEYDKMDEEEKGRCILRSGHSTISYYGFVYVNANNASSNSNSNNGARLNFKVHRPCFSVGRSQIVPLRRRRVAMTHGRGV